MNARRAVQLAFAAAILLGIAALFLLFRPAPNPAEKMFPPLSPAAIAAARGPVGSPPRAAENPPEQASHLADELNAPSGTLRHDLEILNELFVAWQTNFPHTGNPVGENAEITAALAGDNAVHYAFIPKNHPAINARGELCDRWGTPFRFHQLSGTQMEIRSAGPDRKFGTADDAGFSPGSLIPVVR